jgi:hypothetical protein
MNPHTNSSTPVIRRVRAYFAPVDRATGASTIFDAAQNGRFVIDAPPAPWIDLGWCEGFRRTNAEGSNTVEIEFATWGKLQMALACGSQQMNLLETASAATPSGSGGTAAPAVSLVSGSTASSLQMSDATGFMAGDLVSVDLDYTGQTGYVGSGVSGAYVRAAIDVGGDANYIRRVSLNVSRIVEVKDGALRLEPPLLAGVPVEGMKVSRLMGFVDREGGSFFQEWSGLFVMQGEQGDRVIFHYPRLQTLRGAVEKREILAAPLDRIRLAGAFRALPVTDANDGERVLCFRSYLPA